MLENGNRKQVPRTRLDDVEQVLKKLLKFKADKRNSDEVLASLSFEKFLLAFKAARDLRLDYLPEEMKRALCESMSEFKASLANVVFSYFKVNDFEFEVGDGVYHAMRKIVAECLGG